MMKLKYSICCGLDVHKNVIVATIVTTNKEGISEYDQKSFSTINSDIQKFHDWLIENNCYYVCMESTGKYWIPIFNYLEKDIDVCLTHPKYVKAIKGKKTDKKDSKWIADLYKFDLVRCSFIPPKDFRQLRELARYRFKLVCMKSSEKNRIQNCMTVSNIGIASVLKDPFFKTATEIMSYLLEHTSDTIDEKAVRRLIKKGTKATSNEIIEAIKGYNIETDQAKKLELARNHLDYLEDMITQTEVELYVRIKPYTYPVSIENIDGTTSSKALQSSLLTQFNTILYSISRVKDTNAKEQAAAHGALELCFTVIIQPITQNTALIIPNMIHIKNFPPVPVRTFPFVPYRVFDV